MKARARKECQPERGSETGKSRIIGGRSRLGAQTSWEMFRTNVNHWSCSSITMAALDFKTAVKQEEDYLRSFYPTPADIPGCLNLFETWTGCNGESSCPDLTGTELTGSVQSSSFAGEGHL
jgi:hypothetical protein